MSCTCRKGIYTMKPTLITVIAILLFSMPATLAQKRSTHKPTRAPRSRVQPLPQPTPTPAQKSEDELKIEKELSTLSSLSAEDKATVRAAIEGMNRASQVLRLRGVYDEYYTETERIEPLVLKADKVLPSSTFLKGIIGFAWRALQDAVTAEVYYRKDLISVPSGADAFLKIVNRYKLKGVSGALIGEKVLDEADAALSMATTLAQKAGIMPASEQ